MWGSNFLFGIRRRPPSASRRGCRVLPQYQLVCINLSLSICLYQFVFLSICLYQFVCINLFLTTCLYQLVSIKVSLSICLYQFVSINLYQLVYINLSRSTCTNLSLSTYLYQLISISTCLHQLFEGSLGVKLPTIWTDEKQSTAEAERRERLEERRSEKRKSQKKEDADARKCRKVAKHCVFPMICGSGGSKSRLAKAAGAEPAGQMRDEKLHAVVARSTFRSQNVQNTPASDHFWKLRC